MKSRFHALAFVTPSIKIKQRFQISYWDAAIVGAAKRLNCGILYSEDLSEGQSYDGVRVVNPFRSIAKT
jgi:predicted nucleic acid-binding protein